MGTKQMHSVCVNFVINVKDKRQPMFHNILQNIMMVTLKQKIRGFLSGGSIK
jgi:hypothetical protein